MHANHKNWLYAKVRLHFPRFLLKYNSPFHRRVSTKDGLGRNVCKFHNLQYFVIINSTAVFTLLLYYILFGYFRNYCIFIQGNKISSNWFRQQRFEMQVVAKHNFSNYILIPVIMIFFLLLSIQSHFIFFLSILPKCLWVVLFLYHPVRCTSCAWQIVYFILKMSHWHVKCMSYTCKQSAMSTI